MKRIFVRKKGTMVAAAALVAALAPTPGKATVCSDAPAAETLHMTVQPVVWKAGPGGAVKLIVTVNRGVGGDVQSHVPASGVESMVVLNPTWPYMAGAATTGADGTAVIKIEVPKNAPRGWLDGYGVAKAEHVAPVCGESATEKDNWTGERIVKIRR